jgi:ribulose-bisphosphate carboxylase large chain
VPKKEQRSKSRLYKHKGNFTWKGIKTEKYKPKGGNWADIVRRVIVGDRGESARFHFRYFEISPGGYSSFEEHRHAHVVVCVRGKGKVRTSRKMNVLGFLDTLYIAPDTPHQLSNPFDEPFGFFCIVNARRDRPKILG